jgi:hypothetical protein
MDYPLRGALKLFAITNLTDKNLAFRSCLRLYNGLQIRGHRFEFGTRLHFRKHLIFVWLVIADYPMMVMPKIPLLVDRIISPKDQFLNLLWDW